MVEFSRVFLDPLHLLIRVGDLLLEKLINEVLDTQVGRCTKCQKESCASCPCDCHTATLNHLVSLAKEAHCHLDFWVKESEDHGDNNEKVKKLKWGTPYGRELHNLLLNLNLAALLPSRADKIKAVWSGFLELHAAVDSDHLFSAHEINEFKTKAKAWVHKLTEPSTGDHSAKGFKSGMYSGCVTPYIHALVYHVPEMLQACASMGTPLRFFSAEPVEGKNHVHVHRFFASTHRDGGWPGEGAEVELMQIERRLFYDEHVLHLPHEASKLHTYNIVNNEKKENE